MGNTLIKFLHRTSATPMQLFKSPGVHLREHISAQATTSRHDQSESATEDNFNAESLLYCDIHGFLGHCITKCSRQIDQTLPASVK